MEKNNNYFTVEATPNQTLMKEGYQVVVYRSWRGIVNIGLAVLCLGIAAYKAYDAWHWTRIGWEDAWEHNLSYIVYFLLIGGFVLGRLIAAPELGARKYMRRLTAVHGDCSTLHISYFFADDVIRSDSSTGQKTETAYDQIISVHETASGIVLRRKLGLFEIIDKSKIQGGTLEEFRSFLLEKMPNARFHWKH